MSATLGNARALAPRIRDAAPILERDRVLPPQLLEELKRAGVFRMYVPKAYGGDELSATHGAEVIEEVARADASVGWLVAIGADAPAFFAFLPPETYAKIYARGPDVIHAGGLIPRGKAVLVDGGYRFSGQWPFASGCAHADYLSFSAPVDGGDGSRPRIRFGLVPSGGIEIVDTWHVSGLSGTGSHDLRATDLFVPEEWTGSILEPPAIIHHPLDRLRPLGRLGVQLGAVALGTARGALDDLVEIGRTKRPAGGLAGRLAESPVFQRRLGELDLELRIARTLLYDVTARLWESAKAGRDLEQRELLEQRSIVVRVGELAVGVVDGCYRESGTTGLFRDHPLQRRHRDIHAVVKHMLLSTDALGPLGALLLGEEVRGVLI